MKKIYFSILIAAGLLASSCSVTVPVAATSNKIVKEGVAERKIWFGLAFGHTNVGIEQAAKNGGIKKIATVDYSVKRGLFSTKYKTIVTGE